jgi:cytochrome c oxidase assembly factor CtaG
MKRGMLLLVVSSVVIIAMLSPLEPIDFLFAALADLNVAPMVLVMVSDILLLIAGYMLASAVNIFLEVGSSLSEPVGRAYSHLTSLNRFVNKKGLVSLGAGIVIVALWYVPTILEAALLQFELHLLMHMSLLFAGGLIFVGFQRLSTNMRLLSYLLGCKGMAIFGAYLLVSGSVLYGSFPYPEQAEAGAAMVAMCFASDATIIPLWLRRYFNQQRES